MPERQLYFTSGTGRTRVGMGQVRKVRAGVSHEAGGKVRARWSSQGSGVKPCCEKQGKKPPEMEAGNLWVGGGLRECLCQVSKK